MVRAPDLTRADWQGRVGDEDIAQVIRNGRNSMPKFDLPSLGVYLLMGEHLDPWTSWERHWIVVEDEPRTSWPALTGASRRSRVTELLLLPP